MDYKPYTIEWTRKRYLSEAIHQYFDADAAVDVILDDIMDILVKKALEHRDLSEKFQEVLNGLKSLSD